VLPKETGLKEAALADKEAAAMEDREAALEVIEEPQEIQEILLLT
jgi:hypothetical protein